MTWFFICILLWQVIRFNHFKHDVRICLFSFTQEISFKNEQLHITDICYFAVSLIYHQHVHSSRKCTGNFSLHGLGYFNTLIHWSRLTQICVGYLVHHWLRWWLVACFAPSHCVNQCWSIVTSNRRNKLSWNSARNLNIFIHENAFQSTVYRIASILYRVQCVNAPIRAVQCDKTTKNIALFFVFTSSIVVTRLYWSNQNVLCWWISLQRQWSHLIQSNQGENTRCLPVYYATVAIENSITHGLKLNIYRESYNKKVRANSCRFIISQKRFIHWRCVFVQKQPLMINKSFLF